MLLQCRCCFAPAIEQYLLPARPITANSPCAAAAGTDRQTDTIPLHRPCSVHYATHTCLTALFRTTRVSRYQKGKTNRDFTEARDSEWQWHQLGCMQVCTLLQTVNHASTPPLRFLPAGCPSCRPTKSKHCTLFKQCHIAKSVILWCFQARKQVDF